ncbi:MAG: hypothetical protein GMKNLPBB_03093 [Myxococcota bacterium]|nr:hypothetical protein [Myxococcota bacterium]
MNDLLDYLANARQQCERAAQQMKAEDILAIQRRLMRAIEQVGLAWSGSCIGYQARVYIRDFQRPGPVDRFDDNWRSYAHHRIGLGWVEYNDDEVKDHVNQLAEVPEEDWQRIKTTAASAAAVFSAVQSEIVPTLDAVLAEYDDERIREKRNDIARLKSYHNMPDIAEKLQKTQYMMKTSDLNALKEGWRIPPHIRMKADLDEQFSYGKQVEELAKEIRYIFTYLKQRQQTKGKLAVRTDGKIFIGHGQSKVWLELKNFVQDDLHLQYEEFNREPPAGKATKERLEEMLGASSFAFLVMTAEDETADGKLQARANVIHEIGLFQGRLGFNRAIMLLEEGCEEFSNITGINQIRFPKGNIRAIFEEIRRVLVREKILP